MIRKDDTSLERKQNETRKEETVKIENIKNENTTSISDIEKVKKQQASKLCHKSQKSVHLVPKEMKEKPIHCQNQHLKKERLSKRKTWRILIKTNKMWK